MSTRSCIARGTVDSFTGVYHHWDGYPSGLGAEIWKLFHKKYKGNEAKMLKALIDDHPAGWSSLFKGACFCHGECNEGPNPITEKNASACGGEYAYVFPGDGTMRILSSYYKDGAKMIGAFGFGEPTAVWKEIKKVKLANKREPKWESK